MLVAASHAGVRDPKYHSADARAAIVSAARETPSPQRCPVWPSRFGRSSSPAASRLRSSRGSFVAFPASTPQRLFSTEALCETSLLARLEPASEQASFRLADRLAPRQWPCARTP